VSAGFFISAYFSFRKNERNLRTLRQNITTMKRIIPAAVILFAAMSLTSCGKRDFTCTCKLSNGGTQEKWIGRVSNNTAQKICNDYQLELKNNPNGVIPICKTTY
jgi:hypothetical protein